MLSHLMDLRLVTLASNARPSMVKPSTSPSAMPSRPASRLVDGDLPLARPAIDRQ